MEINKHNDPEGVNEVDITGPRRETSRVSVVQADVVFFFI